VRASDLPEQDRSPSIRRATEADLPQVLAMADELSRLQEPWRVFPPRAGLDNEMRRSFQAALVDPDAILVVAEGEDGLAGMAAGHVHRPSLFSDQRAVELASVYVKPAYRRLGLARELTAWVAEFARRRGVGRLTLKIFAQNEEGLAAWEAMGFEARTIQMTIPVQRLTDGP
jgi:ribosomal protein S18 acetylase RimI-like enzyme